VTASVSHAGASAFASDGPTSEPVVQVAPLPAAHELIVADAAGLSAHLWDGSSKRMISPGSTLHPRWYDAESVVALAVDSGHDLSAGARLERISLRDGTRRVLAKLPPFACAAAVRLPVEGQPASPAAVASTESAASAHIEPVGLDVQTTSEFKVDHVKQVACLDLMDRNTNMATLGMRVRVDLASGKVLRWMTLGAEDCQLPADVLAGVPPDDDVCNTLMQYVPPTSAIPSREDEPLASTPADASSAVAAPAAVQLPFGFEDERVTQLKAGGKPIAKLSLEGYEVELASPSGRWLLLGGDPEEGDYMYRRLLLLDRQTGELFAVQHEAGAFPKPLKAQGKRVRTPVRDASLLQFEADVRWVGDSAESELLVIDDLLVRPGERAFSVAGELAF
jgi:hypothetical protein